LNCSRKPGNKRRMMKLVEELTGRGELILNGATLRAVEYSIARHQAFVDHSGLPIPGLHRIEGAIDFNAARDPAYWIGLPLSLKLEDGRVFGIRLISDDGRILSEGHGPSRCLCC
jgi:hypothetical protein